MWYVPGNPSKDIPQQKNVGNLLIYGNSERSETNPLFVWGVIFEPKASWKSYNSTICSRKRQQKSWCYIFCSWFGSLWNKTNILKKTTVPGKSVNTALMADANAVGKLSLKRSFEEVHNTHVRWTWNTQLPWAPNTYMFRGFYGKYITWFLYCQNLYFSWF